MKARSIRLHGVTLVQHTSWTAAHKKRIAAQLAPPEEPKSRDERRARDEARAEKYALWLLEQRGEVLPKGRQLLCVFTWESIREWTKLCAPIAGRPWLCPALDPTTRIFDNGPRSRFRPQHQTEDRIRFVSWHEREWSGGPMSGGYIAGEMLTRVEIPHWDHEPSCIEK